MEVSHPSPGTKYEVYNIKKRNSNSKSKSGIAASVRIDFSPRSVAGSRILFFALHFF